ncbi:MAG: MotA/TolQ/ExbB proton channel family protein [Thermochromatium sp.]
MTDSMQMAAPALVLGSTPPDGITPVTAAGDSFAVIPGFDWSHLVIQVPQRLAVVMDMGGPVMLVLGLLSVVALAIVLLKLWQFGHLRLGALGPIQDALTLWRRHEDEAARVLLHRQRSPVARVLTVAMAGLERPDVEQALLREELVRLASAELEQLRGYLWALEIIGTLSPLLGLLGTVLGMIEAFRQLESAGTQVDPALLSGGIWQALLTTAVGLSVAIPAVLAHTWLERHVERCGHQMEDTVTQVFTRDLVATCPDVGPGHQSRFAATDAGQVGDAD